MSVVAIGIMWAWFAVALVVLSRWPAGKESDRRQAYWAKYEDK